MPVMTQRKDLPAAYTVRMTEELRERVKDAAEDDMRTFNAEVNTLLSEALDARDRKRKAADR